MSRSRRQIAFVYPPSARQRANNGRKKWQSSEVMAANAKYAAEFGDKGKLGLPPARRFAILTCMDARLDPAKYAGLSEGDAHVIRNAGGRATDRRDPLARHLAQAPRHTGVVRHPSRPIAGWSCSADIRGRAARTPDRRPPFDIVRPGEAYEIAGAGCRGPFGPSRRSIMRSPSFTRIFRWFAGRTSRRRRTARLERRERRARQLRRPRVRRFFEEAAIGRVKGDEARSAKVRATAALIAALFLALATCRRRPRAALRSSSETAPTKASRARQSAERRCRTSPRR